MLKIGYSDEIVICPGFKKNNTFETCNQFLNKSHDKLCKRHREIEYEEKLSQIRS